MHLRVKRQLHRQLSLIFAIALVGVGIWGMYLIFLQPKHPTPRYPADVITHSTDAPAEESIDQGFVSKATGNEPALLHIPSIGIEAPIQKVGIDQRGEVAVPANIHVVGWFVDGATPGEPGLSIIDGHLDGPSKKGIFWDLAHLKIGDTFTVERGDKQILSFEVFATKTVKTADAPGILFSQDPTVKSQLNLITCTGKYDKKSRSYDERIIVNARLS